MCLISSHKPFTSLKHESQAWLKTNNILVYKHPFEETTISACGYLFGVHPYHVHRDTVVSRLNSLASDKKLAFNCVMRQKSLGSGKKEDNNNTKPATVSYTHLTLPTKA